MPRKSRFKEVDEEPVEVASVVCKVCNGTGSVPSVIIDGKVDKWKDCINCVKCPDCKGGKLADGSDCPKCEGGRITISKASLESEAKSE